MACSTFFFVLLSLWAMSAAAAAGANLSSGFYAKSCPSALPIIQKGVKAAISKEGRIGASLLRLHFHDCFVNGCDGSVLLDDTANMKGEKNAFPNVNSLRGYKVIDDIKSKLESQCPGVVSCADILALVARDSVAALGGPTWKVPLGRRDSTAAIWDAANKNLPPAESNLGFLVSFFTKNGFTTKDLVALSGAHTIGQGRCKTIVRRISIGENVDPTLVEILKDVCPPLPGADENFIPLDETPTVFDNSLFKNLVNLKGVLRTDQVLYNNASTDSLVKKYSKDSAAFFSAFRRAMIKMGNLNILTGENGEIRTNCRIIN